MPQNSCAINQAWRLSPTPQILAFKHPVCWMWWRECRQDERKTVKNIYIRFKVLKLKLEFPPLNLYVQRFVLQIFFKVVNRERTKRPLAASQIWAVRPVSSPSLQQFLIDRETRLLVHLVAQDCYFGDIKKMSKKKLDTATENISVAAPIWCFRFVLNTTWDVGLLRVLMMDPVVYCTCNNSV